MADSRAPLCLGAAAEPSFATAFDVVLKKHMQKDTLRSCQLLLLLVHECHGT